MKSLSFIQVLATVCLVFETTFVQSQIQWQSGGWAFACDFKNSDLKNAKTSGSQCGPTCVSTSGCTHFTWTSYQGGTCWMKNGAVSQSNAIYTGDNSAVCGIVPGNFIKFNY